MKRNPIHELNPNNSSYDRRQLTCILPLLLDWASHDPSKPFNIETAQQDYDKHRVEYIKNLKKSEEAEKKKAEKLMKEYHEYCRKLATSHLRVALCGEDMNDKVVKWTSAIHDPITGAKVGTPQELTRIDFVRPIDPRKCEADYLHEIRKLYDGKEYEFMFERHPTIIEKMLSIGQVVSPVAKVPYPKEQPKIWRYTLKIQWK